MAFVWQLCGNALHKCQLISWLDESVTHCGYGKQAKHRAPSWA